MIIFVHSFGRQCSSALKGMSTDSLESRNFLKASESHVHLSTKIYLQIQRHSLIGLFDDFATNPIGFQKHQNCFHRHKHANLDTVHCIYRLQPSNSHVVLLQGANKLLIYRTLFTTYLKQQGWVCSPFVTVSASVQRCHT